MSDGFGSCLYLGKGRWKPCALRDSCACRRCRNPPRVCLCFLTAAGSDQGRQRCDFCHRPLPLPRKQSAGGPGALPSLRGQGRLGQHRLRRDQVSLTHRPGRSCSPSAGGSNPAGRPTTPRTAGHLIPPSRPDGGVCAGCHRQNSGGGRRKGHSRLSLVMPQAHLRLHR